MPRTAVKIRSQSIDGLDHRHHGSGSVEAVHVVSPLRRMDGLEQLSSLRKICKACPCAKLVCVINADLVAIGHVSGNHQLGRVLHEVVTFTVLGHRSLESCTL